MTFPTIPTVAAGRIISVNNLVGGAVETFPNLSSLTKNPGDLLIAIIIEYDGNSTNAEFSNWGGGFTEVADRSGTTSMAIGVAYKWSDGTETGTFTVTTADTTTNDSVLILMSIPGAHASTPPEVSAMAVGTSAAANPAALNPAGWDVEDTLWISVVGSGETTTTGSYDGATASPTGYGNDFVTPITVDAIGGVNACIGFKQAAAASEDAGTATVDISSARNAALVIAVRPAPPLITSGEYEFSLTNPSTDPPNDNDHSVTVRAWSTAGSGSLLVRLMQGTTEIDSWSETLSGSATDYNHPVASGNVTNITDYDDLRLELKAQGLTGLTVRVSQAFMSVPEGAMTPNEGSVSGAISWVGSVTGARLSSGAVSGAISRVGSVTGTKPLRGSVSGAISWVGSVTGKEPAKGSVTGAISRVGSVTGTRTPKGSITGAISRVGSVIGKKTPKGEVTGAITRGAGVVVGANLGVVIGSISWAGTVTGKRTPIGSVSGAISRVGTVTGETPLLVQDGSVNGAISWVGSVTGVRAPIGSVSGAISWGGTVTGVKVSQGSVDSLGSIVWIGTVDGSVVKSGLANGNISWVGVVTGISTPPIQVIGFIADDITGPGLKQLIIDGPGIRRVLVGPNLSRVVDGANHVIEVVDGPDRNLETINGPNVSRTVTGPDTNRAVTGPDS